ncbi:D-Ala-D-Ala carboxypeptidase family metallohydrolase [Paramuribaculum intestinale]|uniref:D-Ala-D-Ala carboxypeptidase family metallohydrolase n=1 Tax=Paramuribaculum intestinale TaxID=2094151 RepID=UPI0025A9F2D6|nr:D-Ala-D-Ala carboxypeptidase family metallohydrolase [Paramuribaculum intestinale]
MKYFSFQEFERSDTAYRHGIDNTMPEAAKKNVAVLVDKVLDPLREAWGKPITVTSGYRCATLNKAVGGVPTSMHLTGNAADITTGNEVDNRRLYQLAQELNLPYFELIGKKYGFKWLHVSFNPERAKRDPS